MAVSDQELALRIQVVKVAIGILQSGAHYFWGAPDSGSIPMAPNDFNSDAAKRHVLAASNDGSHFCAGRCNNPAVQGLTAWNGSNAAALASASPTSYRFPRYYLDGDRVNPSSSAAVLGESCANKMHFDCGSFVRYCFRKILGPSILPPNTIMKTIATQIWPAPSGAASIAQLDILPADIVYTANGEHVGIATGSAAYAKSAFPSDQSIHAYYAKVGIIQTAIAGPDPRWGVVRRWTRWTA